MGCPGAGRRKPTEPDGGTLPRVRRLRVFVDRRGDVVSIALEGELDVAEADAFETELQQIEEAHPRVLVIDLSGLTLIDSHGLSALLDADARARAEGRRLVLVPPSGPIMRVFQITLLDRQFEWADPSSPATLDQELRDAVAAAQRARSDQTAFPR